MKVLCNVSANTMDIIVPLSEAFSSFIRAVRWEVCLVWPVQLTEYGSSESQQDSSIWNGHTGLFPAGNEMRNNRQQSKSRSEDFEMQ